MRSPQFIHVAVSLGLGFVLNSVSCGPTCPGLQSCGTSSESNAGSTSNAGSASNAGSPSSAGAASGATCAYLTTVRDCLTAFCMTASNPFCTCYKRGFDLGGNCTCTPFDAQKFCEQAADAGADVPGYDCSSRSGAVASICVGVD